MSILQAIVTHQSSSDRKYILAILTQIALQVLLQQLAYYYKRMYLSNNINLLLKKSKIKLEKIKKIKYFLRLVFHYFISVATFFDYPNFDKFCLQKTFSYLQHAGDRIYIFERAYKRIIYLNKNIQKSNFYLKYLKITNKNLSEKSVY